MRRLTTERAAAARRFLFEHGRPLDQSLYAFAFEGGPADAVLDRLAGYQNADGGFGHALEPDVRLADSSVIATTVALQTLRTVGAEASHPLVIGAVQYLLDTLDHKTLVWSLVPPNVDDAPHAPWWNPRNAEEPPTGFTANPGAEIVGHFHHYASLVPADLLERLTAAALAHIRGMRVEKMHDLFCYEAMRKTHAVPVELRAELLGLARPLIAQVVVTDPAKWTGYCTRPLDVIDSPGSPYHDTFRDAVALNLDWLIETQQPDGAWSPHWSWGPDGGEAWEQSKRDWQGHLIVKHLKTFHAFGRLAV
ncbi:MAG: hypothetical protein AAGI68_08105 [Planctomycetota bacterium]